MWEPIKLLPAYKNYIWGGTKLGIQYGKRADMPTVAESWELSTHRDGQSTVYGGTFHGQPLGEYIRLCGVECLGSKMKQRDDIPIIVKLIDAADCLSVQVHPPDEYARQHEGDNGKTEMWVVLDHEPDAFIYYGVKKEVSRGDMEKAIEENALESLLRKVPVRKGDVFFIPAGTIHAIGRGIVICEIQQSSNVTYRLYDYNRKSNGQSRSLHIRQGLDVACLLPQDLHTGPEMLLSQSEQNTVELLRACECFSVYRYRIQTPLSLGGSNTSFMALIFLEGSAVLHHKNGSIRMGKGNCIFLPAHYPAYKVEQACEFLAITL